MDIGDHKRGHIVFHVTGFGKFNGVPDNPTTHIIKRLPEVIEAAKQKGELGSAQLGSLTVLEVSVEGCRRTLQAIHSQGHTNVIAEEEGKAAADVSPASDAKTSSPATSNVPLAVVYVHCGVDAMSSTFKLETRAYNEVAFRVPDELGFQPFSELISAKNTSCDHCYRCPLAVDALYEDLKSEKGGRWGNDVGISNDAGRFVCNYAYYVSLQRCFECHDGNAASAACAGVSRATPTNASTAESSMSSNGCVSTAATPTLIATTTTGGSRPEEYALFVHVPPIQRISLARQTAFMKDCIAAITRQLTASTTPHAI